MLTDLTLRLLIYREKEWWFGHCLEMDIVAEAADPAEALRDVVQLCAAQFDAAVANHDTESIFKPAPQEYWAMYYRAKPVEVIEPLPKPFSEIEARELALTG